MKRKERDARKQNAFGSLKKLLVAVSYKLYLVLSREIQEILPQIVSSQLSSLL